LLDHAEIHGMVGIFLGTTDRFLAAHRFYEKAGFVRVDPAQLPPSFPRMVVDSRFYHLHLPRT
jgi:N-acetylglutamate synthase-like GNAT family acetyltransferase